MRRRGQHQPKGEPLCQGVGLDMCGMVGTQDEDSLTTMGQLVRAERCAWCR